MPPISTAILGTGMALNHLHFPLVNALPDLYQLTTVLERTDRGIARKVCGPNIKVVSTLAEVLGDATLELVIVATADKTHFEIIKQCLLAKKHVFTDKPLTYSSAEAEELGKLAKKQNVTLSVFQNRRWDGDFLTAAKLIKSGKLGSISTYESYYDFYRPPEKRDPSLPLTWKDDPDLNHGAIYATGTHTIDQAVFLFGVPDKVYGATWDCRGTGVKDCFDVHLTYPPQGDSIAPLRVRCTTNWISPIEPQLKFVLKASKGGWVKYYEDDQWFALDERRMGDDYGVEPEEKWGVATIVKSDGSFATEKVPTERGDYRELYRNVAAAVRANDSSKLAVTVDSVVVQLKVIELALKSAKEDRVMVRGKDY